MDNLPKLALDTLTQHIPTDIAWLPTAGGLGTIVFGLILMLKGARLAPFLAAVAVAVIGGLGASFLALQLGTQPWPTITVGAVVGLVVGILFFRMLLAGLLALCAAVAGVAIYSGTVLRQPLVEFARPEVTQIELRPAGSTPEQFDWQSLWTYLQENVPNFQTSFAAVVLATAIAGGLMGIFMPKASRALFAASAGTLVTAGAAYGLMAQYWPEGPAVLGQWMYAIVAIIWCASLLYNLSDIRGPKPARGGAVDAAPAPA